MHTYNEIIMNCPPVTAFQLARQVDRWPQHLEHYRKVQFAEGNSSDGGLVEMAAYRRFDKVSWPVWWVSEMETDEQALRIRYRHVKGITRGMEVEWRIESAPSGTSKVGIVHEWAQPQVGQLVAARVIGPVFVHYIADQTLKGLKEAAERHKEAAAYG
ncbi:SRPBCC family protein [Paenibacillus mendelii]|uniref:SRPBCC family protein n=1 Tax=Paenibacillus mendelii TaxID=206163 RepID=A0ABV6J8G5_9BACL|nr:SRPBCC family protein [Paenibacillus mendelii]MCQ6560198.1 SRPBCC family protein [Paenibacillus mendelii]